MTPESNLSSRIDPDSFLLAQAFATSRLYDLTHGAGAVEGIEAVLEAERTIASASLHEAEDLVQRVAFPPAEGSETGAQDHLWAALVLMQREKYGEAAACFEQAVALGNHHWRVNCYLAMALGRSGNAGEAFLALNEARRVARDEGFVLRAEEELLGAPVQRTDEVRDFTENGFWTPQTFMLRSIHAWVGQSTSRPALALSIDDNPTLDQILLKRWPALEIERAVYPEVDCQRLTRLGDNTYDVVYSHQVIEHVPRPWLAGQEFVRVLKPGGLGIHTTCAYNPRHGPPAFNDFYRFLPDGLAELFDGVEVQVKAGWGNREAILYNLAIDDGHGGLGGRRFHPAIGRKNDENHPWTTWIIFRKT